MSPTAETLLNGKHIGIKLNINGNANGYKHKNGSFELDLAPGSVTEEDLATFKDKTLQVHNDKSSITSLELTPDERGNLTINSMDVFKTREVEVPKGSTIKVTLLDGTGL